MVFLGIFDYQIRIRIHGDFRFKFIWQIKWPFSSKQVAVHLQKLLSEISFLNHLSLVYNR